MKKLFFVIAIAGIMTSCKDKKDEKKAEETTTATPATVEPTTTTTEPTTASPSDVKFSDPEVQKFADEYSAFVKAYKTGLMDPAKAQELSKTAQEWSVKMQPMMMKLANNPVELKKWEEWALALTNEMRPAMK